MYTTCIIIIFIYFFYSRMGSFLLRKKKYTEFFSNKNMFLYYGSLTEIKYKIKTQEYEPL